MRMRITRSLATLAAIRCPDLSAVSIILTLMAALTLTCLNLALFAAFSFDGVVARKGQLLLYFNFVVLTIRI